MQWADLMQRISFQAMLALLSHKLHHLVLSIITFMKQTSELFLISPIYVVYYIVYMYKMLWHFFFSIITLLKDKETMTSAYICYVIMFVTVVCLYLSLIH